MTKQRQPRTRRTYENGYLPKIAYHLAQDNWEKAQYFTERQRTTYGELDHQDWLHVMSEMRKIRSQA